MRVAGLRRTRVSCGGDPDLQEAVAVNETNGTGFRKCRIPVMRIGCILRPIAQEESTRLRIQGQEMWGLSFVRRKLTPTSAPPISQSFIINALPNPPPQWPLRHFSGVLAGTLLRRRGRLQVRGEGPHMASVAFQQLRWVRTNICRDVETLLRVVDKIVPLCHEVSAHMLRGRPGVFVDF